MSTIVLDYISAALNDFSLTNLVTAASTANVANPQTSNLLSLDDVMLSDGNLVLIKDQTDSSQNGIYQFTSSTTPLQKVDQDYSSNIAFIVQSGSTNANTTWTANTSTGSPTFNKVIFTASDDNQQQAGPVQQTINAEGGIPLTLLNADLAVTKALYVSGSYFSDALVIDTASGPASSFYINTAVSSPLHLGVGKFKTAISINTDNSTTFGGSSTFLGNVSIDGSLNLSNSVINATNLQLSNPPTQIGNTQGNYGQMTLRSYDSAIDGPHLTTFTNTDSLPVLNISSWAHDNISINMDCYYNGIICAQSSPTSCQIKKNNGQLQFTYHNTLQDAFLPALSIDLTDGSVLFSSFENVFSNTDGLYGSIKIAPNANTNETSIALYTTSDLRTSLQTDFWKLSANISAGTFSLFSGVNTPVFTCNSDTSVNFLCDLDTAINVSGGMTIGKDLVSENSYVNNLLTTDFLQITSTIDASSDGGASLVVAGGVQVAKSLIAHEQIAAARLLLSSENARIIFNTNQNASPSINLTSAGTRILLSRTLSPVTTNVAIGVDTGALWYSIPNATEQYSHKWFAGDRQMMSLDGVGNLNVSGQGSAVQFSGLTGGFTISGTQSTDPVFLSFANDWTFGKRPDGSFTITSDNNSQDVLSFSADARSATFFTDTRFSFLAANTIEVSTIMLSSTRGITNAGIFDVDSSTNNIFLGFPSLNSATFIKSIDESTLSINCDTVVGSALRTSNTDINKNNLGNICLWSGSDVIVKTSFNKVEINNDLSIVGNTNINGALFCNSASTQDLQVSNSLKVGNTASSTSELCFLNAGDFASSIQATRTGITISSDGDMSFASNNNVSVYAGNVFSIISNTSEVNSLSVQGNLSIKSDYFGSLFSREGLLRSIAFNGTVYNDNENDEWMYLGRLNTTNGGSGNNECGSIFLRLENGRSVTSNTAAGFGAIEFYAYVLDTQLYASHNSYSSPGSHVYIFKNNDFIQNNAGDYHVFILLKSKSACSVNISSYATAVQSVVLSSEGFGSLPNGNISDFIAGTWINCYDTHSPSTGCQNVGSLTCDQNLEILGSSFLKGDVTFGGGVSMQNITATNANQSFSLMTGDGSLIASFSPIETIISGSIIPANDSLTIGGPDDEFFSAGYIDKITCHNIWISENVTTNSIVSNIAAVTKLLRASCADITNVANIQQLVVADEAIFGKNVTVSGRVEVSSHLDVQGNTTLSDTKINGHCVISGDVFLSQIVGTNNSPVKITAVELEISHDGKTVVNSSGSILSSGEVTLCPNEKPSVRLTQNGDVVISPPDGGFENSSLFVHSASSTFYGNTIFKNQSTFKNAFFSEGLSFESKGAFKIRNENLFDWKDDIVNFYVPGHYGGVGKPKLSLYSSGLVEIHQEGLKCNGQGVFDKLTASLIYGNKVQLCGTKVQTSFDSSLLVGCVSESSSNIILASADGSALAGLNCDANGLTIAAFPNSLGDISDVSNSISLGNNGDLNLNADKTIISSKVCVINAHIQGSGGLEIGKNAENSSGVVICTDKKGENATMKFCNNTENTARLQLYSTTEDSSLAKSLLICNDGGDIAVKAAGSRGLQVKAISGNASLDGALFVKSGLDLQSVETSDETVLALNVSGGAYIRGNILTDKSIILQSPVVENGHFSGKLSLQSSRAMKSDFSLTFPSSGPTRSGSVLCSDLNGNLSWKAVTDLKIDEGSGAQLEAARRNLNTFAARNNVSRELAVPGLKFNGCKGKLEVNVVIAVNTDNLKHTRHAVYDLKGIYRAENGWNLIVDIYGDDIPIYFFVESSTGQITYKADNIDGWMSCTFTWSDDVQDRNFDWPNNAIFGGDFTAEITKDYSSSFLVVNGGNVALAGDGFSDDNWSGTVFKKPRVSCNIELQKSTVMIEDAPESKDDGQTFALSVNRGRTLFNDENDDSVLIKGGLVLHKGLECKSLTTDGVKIGEKGSQQRVVMFGKITIGAHNSAKLTADVKFCEKMNDVNYNIVGNVVSSVNDDSVFVCTFKALRIDGCKVTIFHIGGEQWKDTNLALHYRVIA